jgi:hypothetical protein
MMQKDFEFILKSNVDYHQNGESVKAKKLLLRAPSIKHGKLCAKLQQSYKRAQNDQQEKLLKVGIEKMGQLIKEIKKTKTDEADAKSANVNGKEIIELLQSSSSIEFSDFLDLFKELLLSGGVCLLDGKIDLLEIHYEKMSYSEIINLIGEYFTNFLLSF